MKRYLLDTSLLAGFFHQRKKAVDLIAPWLQHHTVVTSILVYGEVIEYLKGLPNFPDHYAAFHEILAEIPPYPLTYPILDRYADIRRTLRPVHQDIGDIDTLIAATAVEHDLTLVTIDTDFDRVPDLKFELVNLKKAA
jgi:tRNA(fMet)-specific endonuclease VapC